MRILWLCGLPFEVQERALGGGSYGAYAAWSWVMGHLPPPPGVELHIACRTSRHTQPQTLDYRDARIHLVPVRSRGRAFSLFQFDSRYFAPVVRQIQPDIIHGWGTEDAYALAAIRLAPQRHLVQVQGNVNAYRQRVPMSWITWFTAWSERIALRRARHVVAENDYSLDSVRSMVATQSLHVVEHPIRSDFLTGPPVTGQGKQVVFIGAVEERKGIWDAVTAFNQAAPADWKFTIIGNGLAPAIEKLHTTIRALGLTDRVIHHPRIEAGQIVDQLRLASVFLLPTRIDTGPTALKEAIAMGLWPVCYDNSGPGHYVRQFQFGTLARDLDPSDLAAKLKQVIAAAPWQQPEHRVKIESVIRPQFQRERIWGDLLKLYEHITATSR